MAQRLYFGSLLHSVSPTAGSATRCTGSSREVIEAESRDPGRGPSASETSRTTLQLRPFTALYFESLGVTHLFTVFQQ